MGSVTTAHPDRQEPDQLDVLATEVGVGLEQELEREGLLGKAKSGAAAVASVPAWTRAKVGELVDTGLDRVYAQPLEIGSADEAVALLTELGDEGGGREQTRRVAGILAAAGPVMARLARGTGAVAKVAGVGAKVFPSGRMFTVGTTAVLASIRIGTSARIGVRELQVLASYLMARLRAAGLPVDRDLVEQVTVQAYVQPGATPRLRPGARRGFAGLARFWAARGFKAPSPAKQAQLHRRRVEAIERLDLPALVADWRRLAPPT
jgi:hypothetical protein